MVQYIGRFCQDKKYATLIKNSIQLLFLANTMTNNNISLYQQRLNLQNATFTRIEHADATVALVYKIACPDGTNLILKICSRSHDYARELYFLNFFANAIPVPRIIDVVPPEADIDGAILMEYLPGTLLIAKEFTGELAYTIGQMLARIHSNRTPGYGDLTQPDSLNSDPRIPFAQKFHEGLDECKDNVPHALIEKCLTYFDTHLDLLAAADGPCIIHRDFRLGNIITHNGKISGIIDWSSARASFAQEDFCFLEREKPPIDSASKNLFLVGYASVRPVPNYQTVMPLLLLHRSVAAVGFTVKRGTWNISNADMYQTNRQFIETF